jgi:hypothetical protein
MWLWRPPLRRGVGVYVRKETCVGFLVQIPVHAMEILDVELVLSLPPSVLKEVGPLRCGIELHFRLQLNRLVVTGIYFHLYNLVVREQKGLLTVGRDHEPAGSFGVQLAQQLDFFLPVSVAPKVVAFFEPRQVE